MAKSTATKSTNSPLDVLDTLGLGADPDNKVAHLGADLRKLAETKTKEFNAAYAKLEKFYAAS